MKYVRMMDMIAGVNIRMTEAGMQDDSLTFDCTFTFDGDISEMKKEILTK